MKYLKSFENLVEWKQEDLDGCFETLFNMVEEAAELIGKDDLDPEEAIILLRKIGTEYSLKLADDIDNILKLIAEFDVESEIEKSKLN